MSAKITFSYLDSDTVVTPLKLLTDEIYFFLNMKHFFSEHGGGYFKKQLNILGNMFIVFLSQNMMFRWIFVSCLCVKVAVDNYCK